jgi:hypothetical protein
MEWHIAKAAVRPGIFFVERGKNHTIFNAKD